MPIKQFWQKCVNKCSAYSLGYPLIALTLSFVYISPVNADLDGLKFADNLEQIAQEMNEKKLPLLLAFVADYCSYCRQLEETYLSPMEKSSDYAKRILIRQIDISNSRALRDFAGKTTDSQGFADRLGVSITPTLLFVDSHGTEVAERLLGYNVPDFYGVYLERAIDTAHAKVNAAEGSGGIMPPVEGNGGTPPDVPPSQND